MPETTTTITTAQPPTTTESSTITAPPASASASADLAEARALAADIRFERDVQQALFDACIIDLEAGLILANKRRATAPGIDIAAIVKELRTSKPALFKPQGASTPRESARRALSATLAPASDTDARTDLSRAAAEARASGNGRSLMDYLRLRRQAAD